MERKKLLMVAISMGAFLVVVIGAAYLAFSPGPSPVAGSENRPVQVRESAYPEAGEGSVEAIAEAAGEEPPVSMDPVDAVRNPGGIQTLWPSPYAETPAETGYLIPAPATRPGVERSVSSGASRIQINITPPKNTAVPAPAVSASRSPASSAAASAAGASSSTRAKTPAPAAPAAPAPAPVSEQAEPEASAAARTYDTYWIQTGAFLVMARAEGVKETLASKGITSIIENRDMDGNTFFRVRVGPYTTKNEADYWLALVKAIDGFEDSMVMQNRSRL